MEIRPVIRHDWPQILKLIDEVIGPQYYTANECAEFHHLSQLHNMNCSFVLVDNREVVQGARITFAPGTWIKSMKTKIHPSLWGSPQTKAAYFKSLVIDKKYRGQGWGPKLSAESLKTLRTMNTECVICHSWKESPNNSSQKYLLKYGFKALIEIPDFWIEKDYLCVRCAPDVCRCTAIEMIYKLS